MLRTVIRTRGVGTEDAKEQKNCIYLENLTSLVWNLCLAFLACLFHGRANLFAIYPFPASSLWPGAGNFKLYKVRWLTGPTLIVYTIGLRISSLFLWDHFDRLHLNLYAERGSSLTKKELKASAHWAYFKDECLPCSLLSRDSLFPLLMRFRLKSILERAESQRQSKDLCYTRFLSLLFDSLSFLTLLE